MPRGESQPVILVRHGFTVLLALVLLAGRLPALTNLDHCNVVMSELVVQDQCRIGFCHDNIRELIVQLKERIPGFDITKARVLVITRPQEFHSSGVEEPNLSLLKVRKEGTEAGVFHVILEYEGKIFDLTLEDGSQGVSPAAYFPAMFVKQPSGNGLTLRKDVSESLRRLMQRQIDRNAITTEKEAHQQLRVHLIPAADYLNKYHAIVTSKVGDLGFFWEELAQEVPATTLGAYLGVGGPKGTKPKVGKENIQSTKVGDAKVTFDERKLEVGDLGRASNAVEVMRPGYKYPERFNRTNHGIAELQTIYSPRLLNVNELKGKVVLDVSTGGGRFPEELREAGVVAYGMDVALNPRQTESMHADTRGRKANDLKLSHSLDTKPFIWADAYRTRIADQQVDVIYDFFGVVTRELYSNPAVLKQAFEEWRRVLKVGGVIRFGPVDESSETMVRAFIKGIKGLELTAFEGPEGKDADPYARCVEVTRRK